MSAAVAYGLAGAGLVAVGLYALVVHEHLLRKILAINVIGNGVFLVLVSAAQRGPGVPDPVPHAMVLTGIVVAVSATALALALAVRVRDATGQARLGAREDGTAGARPPDAGVR
jgi:multicomponent Na+:H+ antiporter subunit C